MPRHNIFDMAFSKVYPMLVQKAERKGRTKAEVDEVTSWNPRSDLITGKVCGIQVETIEEPMMKKIRQLDKLVDELAKGKPMEKVIR